MSGANPSILCLDSYSSYFETVYQLKTVTLHWGNGKTILIPRLLITHLPPADVINLLVCLLLLLIPHLPPADVINLLVGLLQLLLGVRLQQLVPLGGGRKVSIS